ncbi:MULTISPECIES: hypothetical protein [Serratia]|uniref:hypothetical protein n=1 Tax=Serratia TaxID=613 RepID=UPI001020404D|nr:MULTISPECIES: hypothetical protein [Serratia]RZF11020.1 hypothetical protein B7L32_22960 [Serratia marcescens]TXE64919.1 hypothetical protein FOT59_25480 [Serratia nevei]
MTSKPSQQFATFWAVLAELESSGHPQDSLWIKAGKDDTGEMNYTAPIAFIAGDCRMLAQKWADGTSHTLYGYDRPNAPGAPGPTVERGNGVHYLPSCIVGLELFLS